MAESPLSPDQASAPELEERMRAERTGMPFLMYRDAGGKQHLHGLEDTASRKITIGRDWTNDICLTWDAEVSGIHAELERIGDHWAVLDDGLSRNGTYVNDERVRGRRRLRDGDMLRFGATVGMYRAPSAAGSETIVAAP